MKEQIKSTRGKRVIKIIIVVIVLVHILPFPINKQFETVEFRLEDDTYIEERTVTIQGRYYFRLFTKDKFVGQITVSSYPLTQWEMDSLKVTGSLKDIDHADLSYNQKLYNEETSRWKYEFYKFGSLISNRFFNKIVIALYSNPEYPDNTQRPYGVGGGWGTASGLFIVPSAKTRDEAVEKINEWGIFD